MRKTHEVDAYMKELSPGRRSPLAVVRDLIHDAIPAVRETMRYRMPTYELDEVVCCFASQKHYMSLYLDAELVEANRMAFIGLDVGKSCVRFRRLEDLPLDTVREIIVETARRQAKDE